MNIVPFPPKAAPNPAPTIVYTNWLASMLFSLARPMARGGFTIDQPQCNHLHAVNQFRITLSEKGDAPYRVLVLPANVQVFIEGTDADEYFAHPLNDPPPAA